MSCATNRPVEGDKLTQFLQHTLGTLAEGYVVSLAELSSLKEPRHQKELLNLKVDLKAKDDELAALRKKLEKAEAELASMVAKQTQVQKPKLLPEQPVTQYFAGWQKMGFRVGATNTELQCAAILDNYKNLMWAMNTSKSDSFPHPDKWLTWQQAQDWVKQVNAKGWCGYHNWRLPTCDELSLILLLKAKDDFLLNNTNIQNSVAANIYWTSTTKVIAGIQPPYVFVVSFKSEFSYMATQTSTYQVRLVRSV